MQPRTNLRPCKHTGAKAILPADADAVLAARPSRVIDQTIASIATGDVAPTLKKRSHLRKVGRTLRALRVDAPAKLIAKKSEARAAREKRRDQLQQMAREIVKKVPNCIDRYITESAAEQARAESDLAEKEARLEEVREGRRGGGDPAAVQQPL